MRILDLIPIKYRFYYNPRWVANTSPTKRISIRKIKAYPILFVSDILIEFTNNALNGTIRHNI
jgi:hypothetical protein